MNNTLIKNIKKNIVIDKIKKLCFKKISFFTDVHSAQQSKQSQKHVLAFGHNVTYNEKYIFYHKRCQNFYKQIICQDFILKQNIKNIMQIPQITKIVLNTTSKYYVHDKKYLIPGLAALELISGQKFKYTRAKKSIATFKLRENQCIGCKLTLRGENMFYFLEKFSTSILPKVRDISGCFEKNFDNKGNLTLGINNLLIFAELEKIFELFDSIQGINITFVTSSKNQHNAKLIMSGFQLPMI